MKKTEDELLTDRIKDLIIQVDTQHKNKFTHFLNERECYIAEDFVKKSSSCMLYGGYDNAKRKMLGVFNGYEESRNDKFPLKCIKGVYRKQDEISHSDVLGSLMALQIKRNSIGDIIIGEGVVRFFAEEPVTELILSELMRIGKVGVSLSVELKPSIVVCDKYIDLHGLVSSFRTDGIIAFVTNLSRSKAQSLIISKGIMLNYKEIHDVSKQMKTGDIFSIQGYGKYIFSETGNNTRSGRIHILIRKYQ